MKKKITLFVTLCCLTFCSLAYRTQAGVVVCDGDVTLSSQAEVDAFDCTEVTGFLRISGADITNLDGLSGLTRVGGVQINDNPSLTDVAGLSSLEVLTGTGGSGDPVTLSVSGNQALLNLDGLSGLTTVPGIVEINSNTSLENIDGFPLITQMEILSIRNNAALTSINGFGAVISMSRLIITDNASVRSLNGFSSLERVAGRAALVIITNNAVLASIDGLSSLTQIEGSPDALLQISENPSLRNVNGLFSLSFVSGFPARVLIDNNLALENIDGLSALEFLPGDTGMPEVVITNNPLLIRCCGIYPFLSAAQGVVTRGATIENNGAGCTVEDILGAGACPQSVSGFSLINERTGAVVEHFFDSIAVDRTNPDFFKWTIQANTFPEEVGSVVFRMDNKRKHMDNVFPYTVPRHMFTPLKPGIHVLTAQVYSRHHKRGDKGIARTAIIEIINTTSILNFEVVNKDGDVLMELQSGDEINIKDPAFRKISIRAITAPEMVGSVKFHLDKRYRHIENQAPYALFGDHNGMYDTRELKPGHYKLVATPYSKSYAQGHAGESLTVHFKVTKKETYHNNAHEIVASHREEPFVSIYPVPVKLELHIRMTNLSCRQVVVAIRDTFGRPVYSRKLDVQPEADYSISTADLKVGVYYLHVLGDNGYGKVIKFVKQ